VAETLPGLLFPLPHKQHETHQMYGKRFNHKAPFGEIYGDPRFAFEQDGQLYNGQKMPVDGNGNAMPVPPLEAAAERKAAPVADARPALSAADADEDVPADEKELDIVAWARGDEALKATPWQAVRAAVAREFEDMTAITGKEAARKAILAKHGAAPAAP
jgi:hypothetical protein